MSEFRDLKCKCCKCYDSFDGCTAFDCQYDYEFSLTKAIEVSKDYQLSVESLYSMFNKKNDESHTADCKLPDDFDPAIDTKFLISFADATEIGKKRLIDMDIEDLKRLRDELNFVLEARNDE